MDAKVREIPVFEYRDERGSLVALEELGEIVPFEVKRVYYIFDTKPDDVRGQHAHRDLKQFLVCVSGACTITCELPDGTRTDHRLDWPTKGLLVEGMVWREMKNFSKDSVLLVLASEHYTPSDYIRDYAAFRRAVEALREERGS